MSGSNLPALIFDCDGVLVDSEYLASRVESELIRDLGLTLSVEEVHDLFLGKTVDGVLDAIAARTGQRPSTIWANNWAFATAHAFRHELKMVEGVGAAVESLRQRGHRMPVVLRGPLQIHVQLAIAKGAQSAVPDANPPQAKSLVPGRIVRAHVPGRGDMPEGLGLEVAEKLLAQGARGLIDDAG